MALCIGSLPRFSHSLPPWGTRPCAPPSSVPSGRPCCNSARVCRGRRGSGWERAPHRHLHHPRTMPAVPLLPGRRRRLLAAAAAAPASHSFPQLPAAAHHSGLLHLGHEQAVLLERCLQCLWGQKGIKKCQLEAGDDHRGDGMCSCPCLNLNLITSGLQSIAYIGLPGNAPASCCYLLAAAITGTPHRAAAFTTPPGVFFSASAHGFQAPYSPS